jgi:predicted nuclease with TOPRIM domain
MQAMEVASMSSVSRIADGRLEHLRRSLKALADARRIITSQNEESDERKEVLARLDALESVAREQFNELKLQMSAPFDDLETATAEMVRTIEALWARWPEGEDDRFADTLTWLVECVREGVSLSPPTIATLEAYARGRKDRDAAAAAAGDDEGGA